ncbi:MAG: hypothetical protein ACW98F_00480 [Candidatus Hodarchaeales archaeon]|jgi:hypothetical protein
MMEFPLLEEPTKKITTKCPICGKCESITINLLELEEARSNHSLLTKAIPHAKDGHVLTLYIDGEGVVRRKYCFDLVRKNLINVDKLPPGKLDNLFEKMINDSMRSEK